MELSKRLLTLVKMIRPGKVVADVGCDHGYVSIYLAKSSDFEKIIAMDVRSGPLDSAKRNIQANGLQEQIETRLSDGMQALGENEADTLICAGMGGELIIHILSQDLNKARNMKQLILQPQSELFKVRKFLYDNGFSIIDEDMVIDDGKYYPMMCAMPIDLYDHNEVKCNEKYIDVKKLIYKFMQSKDELDIDVLWDYGPILLLNKNEVLHEFLNKEKGITEEVLRGVENPKKHNQEIRRLQRINELKYKLVKIDKALSYF